MNGDALTFAPLMDVRLIGAMGLIGLAFVVIGLLKQGKGSWVRLVILGILLAAMMNPRFVREQRELRSDIAVIVIDRTSSQNVGERKIRTETALQTLRQQFQEMVGLELREVEVIDGGGVAQSDRFDDGSNLMSALRRAVGEIPKGRFAGAMMITDGQVHDVPRNGAVGEFDGPVHVLLSGKPDERDRRLVVDNAPGYGIVGQELSITYHVEDKGLDQATNSLGDLARVTLRGGDKVIAEAQIPVGKKDTLTFTVEHAGPSILEIEVAPVDGELSDLNNRTLISINGVRDRLKVLLVSGYPHAGERTWRNLLKADPSVDLVHFTILRPLEKDDFTPLNELALITFPVRELFEAKLDEFDLVIFDRYILRDILPPTYLHNLAEYVNDGGAMLLSVGPEFASTRSLSETALSRILPARPSGGVLERAFRPGISAIGKRHPVTAGLSSRAPINRSDPSRPGWGRWFRQVEAVQRSGTTVMTGVDDQPLLILDRIEDGRVALMLSDHIWLWARGYDGGGPQAELLRRLAHWLMKEPDLEEESLRASVKGGQLHIRRGSLSEDEVTIEVTSPSGKVKRILTKPSDDNAGDIVIPAYEIGLYKISDGIRKVQAASGALNPLEFADLRTTEDYTKSLTSVSGGGMFWALDGVPDLRRTRPDRDASGKGWAGFRENNAYVVTGVRQLPVLPGLALMAVLLALLMGTWWREGR